MTLKICHGKFLNKTIRIQEDNYFRGFMAPMKGKRSKGEEKIWKWHGFSFIIK